MNAALARCSIRRTALACALAHAVVRAAALSAADSPPDWASLLRDPAASVRWVDADTLEVTSREPGRAPVVTLVDAATGGRRPRPDAEAAPPAPQEPASPTASRPAPPPLPEAAAGLAGPASWSPDHAHVVVWEVEPAQEHPVHIVESSPADRIEPKLRTLAYLKPGDRIERRWPRLFTRDGREIPLARGLFRNPWSIDDVRWTADGRRFSFLYNERGHQVLRLVAVDVATGTPRTIVQEVSPTFVDYPHKTFHHWLSDDELVWMSERDGWNHLFLVDAAAGRIVRRLTQGRWMVRGVDAVDAASRTLVVRALGLVPGEDPYHVHHLRLSLDGGPPLRLTHGDGTHTLSWSPDRRWYVDTYSRLDLPPVRELRRGDDGGLVCELGRADAAALLAAGWTRPERFVAPGRDGVTPVWGAIWRPRGTADDPLPRPVVECIYAGPHDFHVPKAFAPDHARRRIADAGFVVVQVDGMGTNWRGKAFHDVAWKNLRDAGLPDHVAWLRAAAATRPWMDLGRVGIYGGSAGGQNALRALLDQPDVYTVAVADCGCHDNRMDKIWWNELWMGWPVDESYARSSNVVDAGSLRGKLMLIVGELDDNVDPASTLQVSAALVRAGKDHDLVVIPNTGHGAAETPYGSMKRLDFLSRHLLGRESGR